MRCSNSTVLRNIAWRHLAFLDRYSAYEIRLFVKVTHPTTTNDISNSRSATPARRWLKLHQLLSYLFSILASPSHAIPPLIVPFISHERSRSIPTRCQRDPSLRIVWSLADQSSSRSSTKRADRLYKHPLQLFRLAIRDPRIKGPLIALSLRKGYNCTRQMGKPLYTRSRRTNKLLLYVPVSPVGAKLLSQAVKLWGVTG